MGNKEQSGEENVEKISALNEIFENVISDASDLIKDLNWGVKTYLLFGLITILFGVQMLVYNMDSIQEQSLYTLVCGWNNAVCWRCPNP